MAISPPSKDRGLQQDTADTLARLRHLGTHFDLSESSEVVKLADALLGADRGRLSANLGGRRRQIEDFSADELEQWWGTLLGVGRIEGIDERQTAIEEALYAKRLQMLLQAASRGVSPESMRLAAEAGSGVPFRVAEAAGRVILTPLATLTTGQTASVYETVRKVAPASLRWEVATAAESYTPEVPVAFHSPSFYVGERPGRDAIDGPLYDSQNYLEGANSRNWAPSGVGSLYPTDGLPTNLPSGGCWHTSPLGAGDRVELRFHTGAERLANRVVLSLSSGVWEVVLESEDVLYRDRVRVVAGFTQVEIRFPLARRSGYTLTFVNADRAVRDLYVKDLYAGLRVEENNRLEWLALGGDSGSGPEGEVVTARAEDLADGEWISAAEADPRGEVPFYIELSGAPVQVSALSVRTDTPGVLFEVDYSTEDVVLEEAIGRSWTPLPGVYRLTNGRIAIEPCEARHLRLTFTSLVPFRLRRYIDEEAL